MARSLGGYDQGYGGGDYSPPARRVFGRVNKAPGDPSGIAPGGDGSGGGYGAGGSTPSGDPWSTGTARTPGLSIDYGMPAGGSTRRGFSPTGGGGPATAVSSGGAKNAGSPMLQPPSTMSAPDPYSVAPSSAQSAFGSQMSAANAAAQTGYGQYQAGLAQTGDAIQGLKDFTPKATQGVDFSAIDNYDPSAALTQYAQGGMKMFNQNLGDALYDTQNKDASLGRLNTGYFDRDRGMTMSRVANQWQGAFADKALEAAQIKAGLLGKSGDLHLGQAESIDRMNQGSIEDALNARMGLTQYEGNFYGNERDAAAEMADRQLNREQAAQNAQQAAKQAQTQDWISGAGTAMGGIAGLMDAYARIRGAGHSVSDPNSDGGSGDGTDGGGPSLGSALGSIGSGIGGVGRFIAPYALPAAGAAASQLGGRYVARQIGGMGGHVAGGALAGAGTGAAIGSIVPGIGTAIGAGVGAAVGGLSAPAKKATKWIKGRLFGGH